MDRRNPNRDDRRRGRSDRSRSRSRDRRRRRSRDRSRTRSRERRRGGASNVSGAASRSSGSTKRVNTWVDTLFHCGSDGKMVIVTNQEGKTMVTCRICGEQLSYNKGGRVPLITHAKKHGIHEKEELIRATAVEPSETHPSPNPNPGLVQFGRQRTLTQVTVSFFF